MLLRADRLFSRPVRLSGFALVFLAAYLWSSAALAGDTSLGDAVSLYQKKCYREAAAVSEAYLKRHPGDAGAYYYGALSYQQLGDLARARPLYRRVVELAPNSKIGAYAASILKQLGAGPGRSPDSGVSGGSAEARVADSSLPERARIFYRQDSGKRIMLNVLINNRPLEMQFDTGAPNICVSKEQLKSLGLRLPVGAAAGKTGGASNGRRVDYWETYADVKLGPILRKHMKLKIIDGMSSEPLLGQLFFKDFDYTIDHSGHSILFQRKGSGSRSTFGYAVPFTFRKEGNRIVLEAEFNGKKGPVMLDTGNSAAGICFDSVEQLKKYGLRLPADARTATTTGVTGEGRVYVFSIKRVKIGPIDRADVEADANIETDPAEDELPLVGQDFLAGWQYKIDMERKVIYFLRR